MKRRFSDEQIIGIIKEYEAGVKAADLCQKRPCRLCKETHHKSACSA